jgi:hypothetical protein
LGEAQSKGKKEAGCIGDTPEHQMNDIKCPSCGEQFTIDEAGYASIAQQVRDQEFNRMLSDRMKAAEQEKQDAIKISQAELQQAHAALLASKELELEGLRSQLQNADTKTENEVTKAEALAKEEAQAKILELTKELQSANSALEVKGKESALELQNAEMRADKEKDKLIAELELQKSKGEQALRAAEDKYTTQIKDREDEIHRLKEMKAKLSTKMIGESLEQHCEYEFDKLRSTAFTTAEFSKDNDITTGSKGDYIYRDFDPESKEEVVSIMFEMKNEADQTATKKRNEDFFKELDKDRSEKGCEYAVLVSLLEPESELYNSGIVDVSHKYPKMYVVRPQFFIPIISLLRNGSMKALEYKKELSLVKAQNIDITNFESDLEQFKGGFARNFDLASRQLESVVNEIDKSIKHLEKTKDWLSKHQNNMRLANDKLQGVSIKKLTKSNPTMQRLFAEQATRLPLGQPTLSGSEGGA